MIGIVAIVRIERRQVNLAIQQVIDRMLERARQSLPLQVNSKKARTRIDPLVTSHRACLYAANDERNVAVARPARQDARRVFLLR